ncbi:calcium and integrin-binding family member 4-like [Xenia sp. Carnegie-2017]|uniref:calcium and integrin-binding family member 4-like n=1 Tax=Xenia sp. Carnegie-2017 TaxID=2897299 RepID=UPI001F04B647|nr:calcium and integrin-binding family member 4-like [Xenia sp. Carnegie-2017]
MGAQQSEFSAEELEEYEELTYLTKHEIIRAHECFKKLDKDAVERNRNARLTSDKILEFPELKVNPFKDRICKVFSSTDDGALTFEDFLNMMSVFSEAAPMTLKIQYAFLIYDFNDDHYICKEDMKILMRKLAGENEMSEKNIDNAISEILHEADLDGDDQLSFAEFENVMSKAPDFLRGFRIRL